MPHLLRLEKDRDGDFEGERVQTSNPPVARNLEMRKAKGRGKRKSIRKRREKEAMELEAGKATGEEGVEKRTEAGGDGLHPKVKSVLLDSGQACEHSVNW